MNKIKIIILLFFALTGAHAENGWYQVSSGNSDLNDIAIVNSNAIYAAGDRYTILKSTDLGISWVYKYSGPLFYNFYSIDFINESTGFVCGAYEQPNPPYQMLSKIFKTSDSGNSWVEVYSSTQYGRCLNIICFNDSIIYCEADQILKSTNAGLSWFDTNLPFRCIQFVNASTGFAFEHPNIKKTLDFGLYWQTVSQIPTGINLKYVSFISQGIGYLLGNSGNNFISKTTNEGLNWGPQNYCSNSFIFCMFCKQIDTIYLSVSGGNNYVMIEKSTNAGLNWVIQTVGQFYGHISSISFLNSQIGFSVGTYGLILKTTTGGVTGIQQTGSEIPMSLNLLQNYPNPFNPVTQISFDIPNTSNVELVVYDQLGREVAVLVNEQLAPGRYKYDWNAADYPSGVYFYKLQAGDFVETKKMVLLK